MREKSTREKLKKGKYLGLWNKFHIEIAFPHLKHLLMDTCRADLIAQLQENYCIISSNSSPTKKH